MINFDSHYVDRILGMLRTGARVLMKRRRNFKELRTGVRFFTTKHLNSEDAPHRSAIFNKISGCSARERDFEQKAEGTLRMLRTGAQLLQNFQDAP